VEHDEIKQLNEKIDVLTAVMAAVLDKLTIITASKHIDDLPLGERVPILHRLGLDRNQIARVCGTTAEVVSVRLAESKRKKIRGITRRTARSEG
jgi:hypothetical protein